RVERIQDERPDGGCPVVMCALRNSRSPPPSTSLHPPVIPPVPLRWSRTWGGPIHQFPGELCCDREEEALCLSRPGSRGHHNVVAVDHRLFEHGALVRVQLARLPV